MRKILWKTLEKGCLLNPFAALSVIGLVVGCGNGSEFTGGSRTVPKDAPVAAQDVPRPGADAVVNPKDPVPPSKYQSLTWFWQCAAQSAELPADSAENPVIVGDGTHQLPYANLPEEVPIIFNGKLCPPESQPRDIVFVVDASGSMSDNDHISSSNSCGRLDAVSGLVAKYANSANNVQFAIVTFADVIRFRSAQFYKTADELYSGMATPADVLCSSEMGGTRYDIALDQAKELLLTGRADATKEIYFISDGEPELDHTGIPTATELKDPGILVAGKTIKTTIATIMLKGNDTIMESSIASKDENGKPLHALVSNSGQLAETLASLASSYIIRAEIRYRISGSDEWVTLDVMKGKKAADLSFEIPPVMIMTKDALQGIEVEYEYWNNNNQSVKSDGMLQWKIAGQ